MKTKEEKIRIGEAMLARAQLRDASLALALADAKAAKDEANIQLGNAVIAENGRFIARLKQDLATLEATNL